MPDRVGDDDAGLAGVLLVGREGELAHGQREDVQVAHRPGDMAEREGFEPSTRCREPHFQCGAIVH